MVTSFKNLIFSSLGFFYLVCFFACTSVRVEEELLPEQRIDAKSLAQPDAKAISAVGRVPLRLQQAGPLWVMVRVEPTQNGPTLVKDAWPLVQEQLAQVSFFRDQKMNVSFEPTMSITSLPQAMERVKKENYQFLLALSVREHVSVPTSVFHQFLKSTTLNLYDLLPFFKYNLGSFHANYTSLWEGSLIQLSSARIAFQTSALATVRAFDSGEDLLFDGDKEYEKTAVARAGQLFMQRLSKQLTPRKKKAQTPG